MNTLSSTRISAVSPLAIGIFVAGLLMFGVVAIVRSVTTQGSNIGQTTAAGLASVKAPAVSNNVADALPAFSIQKPADATVVGVFDNQVGGVTLIQPVDDAWSSTELLAVAYGPNGDKWVYGGAWFDCQHIDPVALTYATMSADPALAVWGEMAPRKQNDIAKECGQ